MLFPFPAQPQEQPCKQARAGHRQSASRMRGTDQKERDQGRAGGRTEHTPIPPFLLPPRPQCTVRCSLNTSICPPRQRITHLAVSLHQRLRAHCLSPQLPRSIFHCAAASCGFFQQSTPRKRSAGQGAAVRPATPHQRGPS